MSLLDSYKFFKWDDARKRFMPEWWRRAIVPNWLTIEGVDQTLPITVAAAGTITKPMGFRQPYGSAEGLDHNLGQPFVGKYFLFCDSTDTTALSDISVKLRDVGMSREFSNRPIHIRNLAGTAQLPFRLREPVWFPSDHNISAEFNKLSGGAAKIRFYMFGSTMYAYDPILKRYPEERAKLYDLIRKFNNRSRYIQPYFLTTDVSDVSVTDQGTGTYYAKCGDDGCVELFGITAVSNKEFSVEINEVETRTTLHNGAITKTNGCGSGTLPFKFPTSYLLPAGARLKMVFTDIGTAGSNLSVYFCLYGRKIYAPIKEAKEAIRDLVVPVLADERSPMIPPAMTGMRGYR
jgi:hypothetical protein